MSDHVLFWNCWYSRSKSGAGCQRMDTSLPYFDWFQIRPVATLICYVNYVQRSNVAKLRSTEISNVARPALIPGSTWGGICFGCEAANRHSCASTRAFQWEYMPRYFVLARGWWLVASSHDWQNRWGLMEMPNMFDPAGEKSPQQTHWKFDDDKVWIQ